MFEFFYSYKDSNGSRVMTDQDVYLFYKNTIALYKKKYPESRLPAVAYFDAGLELPSPKENCCTWAMNGVKGLLFSAVSKLPFIKNPSQVPQPEEKASCSFTKSS